METDRSHEQHAELLRLALPLMARYRVPPSPENYAVWHLYASGDNLTLKQRVDQVIEQGAEFTPQVNRELYVQFGCAQNVDQLEEIRANLQQLMQEIGRTLTSVDDDTQRFGDNLQSFNDSISPSLPIQELQALLGSLISETERMQASTHLLQESFEAKAQEVENLRKALEQERVRARTDMMTGLLNRTTFYDSLQEAIDTSGASGTPLCLLMMDIDLFKKVNDTHGHLVGDRVIKFVAQTIRHSVKGRDVAARYGGEEFAVLLPNTPQEGGRKLGQDLVKEIAAAKLLRADTRQPLGQVTISVGLASFRAGEEAMRFVERADQALYQAKRLGRNRLFVDEG